MHQDVAYPGIQVEAAEDPGVHTCLNWISGSAIASGSEVHDGRADPVLKLVLKIGPGRLLQHLTDGQSWVAIYAGRLPHSQVDVDRSSR